MQRATQNEIKEAYQGLDVAQRYVDDRFVGALHRLLHETQVRVVQSLIDRISPANILEIAPGPGRVTRDLRHSARYVCLEYNQGMIEVGRRSTGEGVQWVRGDAFHLPLAPPFDLACSFRFIRHFRAEDRRRLYAQVHDLLRPGGYLVFDAVNAPVSRPLRAKDPDQYPIYDVLFESVDEVRADLAPSGFELISTTPVQKAFRLQYRIQCLVGPRSESLCRFLVRAAEALSHGPPLEWVVVCRRG